MIKAVFIKEFKMKKLYKILLFLSIIYLINITKAMDDEQQKVSIKVETNEMAPEITPEPKLTEEATEKLDVKPIDVKPIIVEEKDILAKPEKIETIETIEGENFITVPKEEEKPIIISEPEEETHIVIPKEQEKAIIEEPEEEAQIMVPKEVSPEIIEEPEKELHVVKPAIEKEKIEDIIEDEDINDEIEIIASESKEEPVSGEEEPVSDEGEPVSDEEETQETEEIELDETENLPSNEKKMLIEEELLI